METISIEQQLNGLAELMSQRDVARLEHEAAVNALIPPELKKALADMKAEYEMRDSAIGLNIVAFENAIKLRVLETGESVKGARLHAIFVKGRVSWDSKGVEGFALAHPELFAYKHEGEPSVSIRKVQRAD